MTPAIMLSMHKQIPPAPHGSYLHACIVVFILQLCDEALLLFCRHILFTSHFFFLQGLLGFHYDFARISCLPLMILLSESVSLVSSIL